MSDLKKVGAVWLKKKEGKKPFMSGELEKQVKPGSMIFIFKNDGEGHVPGKHPDYTIHTDFANVVDDKGDGFKLDPRNDDETEIPF